MSLFSQHWLSIHTQKHSFIQQQDKRIEGKVGFTSQCLLWLMSCHCWEIFHQCDPSGMLPSSLSRPHRVHHLSLISTGGMVVSTGRFGTHIRTIWYGYKQCILKREKVHNSTLTLLFYHKNTWKHKLKCSCKGLGIFFGAWWNTPELTELHRTVKRETRL